MKTHVLNLKRLSLKWKENARHLRKIYMLVQKNMQNEFEEI